MPHAQTRGGLDPHRRQGTQPYRQRRLCCTKSSAQPHRKGCKRRTCFNRSSSETSRSCANKIRFTKSSGSIAKREANRGVIAADVAPTCENDRAHGLLAAWLKPQSRNCCARVRCADNSHTLVAKAIVIPNFKHSWACLGGAKSRRPKRP